MVTAIVLLSVMNDRINEVAEEIAEIKQVSEVYSITGKHDLAVIVRSPDVELLADVITTRVLKIRGIIDSESMFAFRVFSVHDLESMFSLGLE